MLHAKISAVCVTIWDAVQLDDCDATLGEPCSGVSATPAVIVVAVLALITFSVF